MMWVGISKQARQDARGATQPRARKRQTNPQRRVRRGFCLALLGIYSDRQTISLSESNKYPSEARRSFASCTDVIAGTAEG